MSRRIHVISDTHFGHANALKFTGYDGINPMRQFDSIEDMDDCMISAWNDQVKDGDIVYHLGDVTFCSDEKTTKIMSQLKGRKRLVLGNHDDIKRVGKFFQKIMVWRMFPEFDCVLTHIPMHMSEHSHNRKGKYHYNVHGHIHDNPSPTNKHICVSVEQTMYGPVDLEKLMEMAKRERG